MSTKPVPELRGGQTAEVTVPYFRPSITNDEIDEVTECLRSGWLTTGPRTRKFESQFAEALGAKYAVFLNSGTAALHLAVEALNLALGQAVLVPTLTFAATAEVVRYQGAIPILVDCDRQMNEPRPYPTSARQRGQESCPRHQASGHPTAGLDGLR